MVATCARGQLNRGEKSFAVPVWASEFGLARQLLQSRPASASSFSVPRLDMVLTRELLPFVPFPQPWPGKLYLQPSLGSSGIFQGAQRFTVGSLQRKPADTGPVVGSLEVIRAIYAAFSCSLIKL